MVLSCVFDVQVILASYNFIFLKDFVKDWY